MKKPDSGVFDAIKLLIDKKIIYNNDIFSDIYVTAVTEDLLDDEQMLILMRHWKNRFFHEPPKKNE